MKREVLILRRAEIELNQIATWWARHRSVDQARRWLAEFSVANAMPAATGHNKLHPKTHNSPSKVPCHQIYAKNTSRWHYRGYAPKGFFRLAPALSYWV